MKNKIYIWLILLYSIVNQNLKAQTIFNYIADINAKVATIPYVFEGQVISVEIYPGDDVGNPLPWSSVVWNGDIGYFYDSAGNEAQGYSRARIKVCKVYKGNIDPGTEIEVLTRSFSIQNIFLFKGGIGDDPDKEPTLHYLNVPTSHDPNGDFEFILPAANYKKKLYFADKLKPIVPSEYAGQRFHSNFHTLYELPFYETVDVPKPNGYWEKKTAYCALVPYVFDDPSQLQMFLNQIQTINPNPTDYCRTQILEPVTPVEPVIDNSQNAAKYNEYLKWLSSKVKVIAAKSNKSASPDDLTLDMLNERLVNIGASSWFEFDIYANANTSSVYLDAASMHVMYNTSVFGTSVVANNNFVATRQGAFNINTYYDVNSDITTNIFGLAIGPNTTLTPLSRVQMSTTPQKLFTVRMKIANCGSAMNVSFTNNVAMAFNSYFATSPNQSILSTVNWDNVNYVGTITDVACDLQITSFNNNIPAGIGRLLTINGKYFGTSKGNGTVVFKNADQGNRYPLTGGPYFGGVQPYDVISWTDNQIVIRLPNMIDSVFIQGYPTQTNMHPGTGKFKVRNHAGNWKETTTPLDIPWSIIQYNDQNLFAYRKTLLKLVNQDSGGYRIHMNNYVTATFNNAKIVTTKAMRDWSCATGIDWFMSSDVATTHGGDPISVQDTMDRPGGVLAFTDRNPRSCPDGAGGFTHYMRSFDISIKENPLGGPWNFDTSGTINPGNLDYYHTLSHELGHAHGIGHINDSIINLMWHSTTNGGYTWPQRKLVKPSFDARTGGNWVTDSLSAGALSCIGAHIQIYPSNCQGFDVKVKKYGNILYDVLVYPNPSNTDENVRIRFSMPQPKDVNVTIYDLTGKEIVNDRIEKTQHVDYDLRTERLEPGMYMMQLTIGQNRTTYKIIKQ